MVGENGRVKNKGYLIVGEYKSDEDMIREITAAAAGPACPFSEFRLESREVIYEG